MRYAAWVVCAAVAVVGKASAQNPTEPATYGNVVLSSGFTPDPHNVVLEAGGDTDAEKLGGDCTGMIANAPDVQLDYKAGQGTLYLSVESDADTTLVVNLPDEKWACNDDSASSLNPALLFDRPQAGIYDIWIGTVDTEDNPAATLKIAGRDLSSPPGRPPPWPQMRMAFVPSGAGLRSATRR